MRWIMCAGFTWLALSSHRHNGWAWCWGAVARMYNWILPIHAGLAVWTAMNVQTLVVIAVYGVRAASDKES